MQQKYHRRQEQLRVELQRLRLDLHEYFTEHERTVRAVYDGLRDRLDRLHRAVSAGNGAVGPHDGSASYLASSDHATPVLPRHGGLPAAQAPVSATPPGDALRGERPADRADWAALTLPIRHEATPAVSPHRPWPDEAPAPGSAPGGVPLDYKCLESLGRLMEDDEMMCEHLRETPHDAPPSARYTADDQQQAQQMFSQSQRSSLYAKPELIPIGTLSAQQNQHLTTSLKVSYANGRPQAVPILDGAPDDAEKLGIDTHAQCKVLVEFKRKRVLQFESQEYVAPGGYVMVGGDRGEDLGLVTYTWCETARAADRGEAICGAGAKPAVLGVGLSGSTFTRSIGHGTGIVLRSASESDVVQLHVVQSELERRAIDVCSQRVLERGLPMTIVDAEYQFDKKKLTFFYEAQQRMDFRELVRDLYKTFRARIWMEPVEN